MNTWACNKYGGVKTIGLCHGVQGAHWQITRVHRAVGEARRADRRRTRSCTAATSTSSSPGINHQTWCIKAQWRGMDMIPTLLRADSSAIRRLSARPKRCASTCSSASATTAPNRNGHLSANTCPGIASASARSTTGSTCLSWINGETGGYLRVCTEGRNWFETDFPNWLAQEPPQVHARRTAARSTAPTSSRRWRRAASIAGHFNVVNHGHITNLPDGCVIEIPGYVDRNGINMPVVGDLPLACAATCSASVRVQRDGRGGRRARRRDAAQAGHAARPAGRRGLQSRRSLADDRRDAGRPGPVAAAVRSRRFPGPPSACAEAERTARA